MRCAAYICRLCFADLNLPSRLLIAAQILAVSTGCLGTVGNYERAGLAGASVVMAGTVLQVVNLELVAPHDERTGRSMQAVAITAIVAGTITAVYALDGIIRTEARADFGPSDAERDREIRRRYRAEQREQRGEETRRAARRDSAR